MEEAEPDAVAKKGGSCFAVERVPEDAAGLACEDAVPDEIDGATLMSGIELDVEGIPGDDATRFDPEAWNRVPLMIPDGGVDAADHLAFTELDASDKAGSRFVEKAERPGAE
jgi:hypothetical protein